MATFTIELGTLVANGFDLGLEDYPIHDEAFRPTLNALIVEHFYFREIGLETPALFKRFLNRKMREIMPVYSELYKSQLLVFDPLINSRSTVDADTTATNNATQSATVDGATTGTGHDDSTGRVLISTTPQHQLAGDEDYASGVTDSHSEGDNTSTGTQHTESTGTDTANAVTNYVQTVTGLSGMTGSAALMEYRRTIINVSLMVIDELEPLFMGLWSNTFGGM